MRIISGMSFLWYWPSGGWDVDAWKKAHPWEPVHSAQSEHKALFPVLSAGTTRAQWETERARWRSISDRILGELNDKPPAKPRWEVLSEPLELKVEPSVVYRRIRYALTENEWGYAWLLEPANAPKPRAALIALHQTVIQGKNEAAGIEGRATGQANMDYGLFCAQHGFTVLVPDAIAFGERAAEHANSTYKSADHFFSVHPDGSVMGKMMFDVSRAVDVLQAMDDVDGDRIGCIGHSHGGYGTIFGMIGDERIKAGVISCGFTTLRTDAKPERWWRLTALMPRLSFYEGAIEQTPIDFHIWLSLIAPRPLFVSAGLKDTIFPNTDNIPKIIEMLRPVWGLYGAEDQFRSRVFDGPHNFPDESRSEAITLLRAALGP